MKHKKFVKLIMAMGYDRNAANMAARYARYNGDEYARFLKKWKTIYLHQVSGGGHE